MSSIRTKRRGEVRRGEEQSGEKRRGAERGEVERRGAEQSRAEWRGEEQSEAESGCVVPVQSMFFWSGNMAAGTVFVSVFW